MTQNRQPRSGIAARVFCAGAVAALAMLIIGYVFDSVEASMPNISAEYSNKFMFRDWPGWTKAYMLFHPIWFGFVFVIGFAVLSRGRPTSNWTAACRRGA